MITAKFSNAMAGRKAASSDWLSNAAEQLAANGLEQDAILAQLDRVRAQPGDFLSDAALGNLAREILRTVDADSDREVRRTA